ncbi:MAG: helix-turn-helix domain-containing protein [Firmicutes bacterium]|nr:helix-turn-helix domain-containing protein [Bacillota bacterium]
MSANLYRLLRKLRRERKLSLRQASLLSGLSHSYLHLLETGNDRRSGKPILPSVEVVKALSRAYGYPYEELLKAAGYLGAGMTAEQPSSHPSRVIEQLKDDVERLLGISYLPLYQDSAAGQVEESVSPEYLALPRDLTSQASFALRVKGDALAGLGIGDGDYVLVREQGVAAPHQITVMRDAAGYRLAPPRARPEITGISVPGDGDRMDGDRVGEDPGDRAPGDEHPGDGAVRPQIIGVVVMSIRRHA